jgi:hypothetical protein
MTSLEEDTMSGPGYGDADAKRIIARAVEIDAEQGRELDAPTLRAIAAEAGISPLAVDRALQEHEMALTQPPPTSWLRRHRTMITTSVIVLALLFFMLVSRTAVPAPLP